jgi:hypothetical protein
LQFPIAGEATELAAFKAVGPTTFVMAVRKLERELKLVQPKMLRQFISYFPVVTYAPGFLDREHRDGATARADGLFAIDGSDYDFFRWVFLHELGHHACRTSRRWGSESDANRFARQWVKKIERMIQKKKAV